MADRTVNGQQLYNFLWSWRTRLLKTPIEKMTEEQFGQLVTLNTVIAYVDDHK